MTPKAKAIELIDKFYDYVNPWNDEGEISYKMAEQNAKKCALITVEEILQYAQNHGFIGLMEYWNDVKNEIQSF